MAALTAVVNDSAGLKDPNGTVTLAVALPGDVAGLVDAVSSSASPALTDSAGLTDAGTRLAPSLTATDLAGLSDDVTATLGFGGIPASVNDAAGLSDTGFRLIPNPAATDLAGLSDTLTVVLHATSLTITISDSVGLVDYGYQHGWGETLTDPAGLADSWAAVTAASRVVVAVPAAAVAVDKAMAVSVTDAGGVVALAASSGSVVTSSAVEMA